MQLNYFYFSYFPHLTFVENESYEFIKNRKYIQVSKQKPHEYTIVYIVIYREDKSIFQSSECQGIKTYISFSLHKEIERYKTNNIHKCIYYEVVSKKQEIQNAMESRALNLIIQNIIGDKYYQYKWK
jgi:hypothetical protein